MGLQLSCQGTGIRRTRVKAAATHGGEDAMIDPGRSGQALLDEIRETRPAPGSVAVWWLGQSGFLIKSAEATVVVDPYLSEHLTHKYEGTSRPHVRMTRAPFRGANLTGVDL